MKTKSLPAFLLTGTLLAAAALSANAAVLTSFETSEGFTANSQTGAAGWTFPNSSRLRVSDGTTEPHLLGDFSLRTVGGADTVTGANALNWVPKVQELNVYSFSFITTATTFLSDGTAGWAYVFLNDPLLAPGSVRNLQLRASYGATAGADYHINYAIGGSGASGFASVSQSAMNFSAWNTISAEFNYTTQKFSVSLNGSVVLNNIALTSGWTTDAIVGTQLVSPSTGTTTYYDAISAVPEPSSAALLGIAGIGLLSTGFRRRSRQLV